MTTKKMINIDEMVLSKHSRTRATAIVAYVSHQLVEAELNVRMFGLANMAA